MTQKQIDAYLRLMDPQILEERTHQDKSGVYGIAQRLAGYQSNHIEGSSLTPEQTADLFLTGTREQDQTAVRVKDVEDLSGHFGMLNEALKTIRQPFTQDLIRQFHIVLKSGVWEDCINSSLPVNIKSEPIRWPVWLHPHRRQWKRILPD